MNYVDKIVTDNYKMKDLSFSLMKANIFSLVLLSAAIVVFILPYAYIWGTSDLYDGINQFLFKLYISIPILFVGTIFHELIHGLCFVIFGKKKFKEIKFGFDPRTLTPFTHCKSPVTPYAYKIGALAPSTILGLFPTLIALVVGHALLLIWGVVFIFLAGADLLTYWKIRNVGKNKLIQDHPERAGCFIVEEAVSE